MKQFSLLLLLCVGVLSCGRGPSLPTGVLQPDKMEAVLWDLLRADQFVTNYVAIRDSSITGHAKGPQLYAAILKKHGITDSIFNLSLTYYKNNPKRFYPILDSIGQQPNLAPTPLATIPAPAPTDTVNAQLAKPASVPSAAEMNSTEKRPSFAPKPLAY